MCLGTIFLIVARALQQVSEALQNLSENSKWQIGVYNFEFELVIIIVHAKNAIIV